ncbi:MAG: spondin domain-containing protein [Bacteroidota bacterium]|nr:spondin domain-containing protein [Bacteroidota bacterium]
MKYLLLLICIYMCSSCNKTPIETPYIFSDASYKVIITMNWTSPQLGVPQGAHVTPIVGMIHSRDTFLWKENTLATTGLKDVAETGNTIKMNAQIDSIILRNKALSKFQLMPPIITSTAEFIINVNSYYSFISFASMIAPSPDWFMGVSNANLFVNNKWVNELVLNVKVYDAGTKDGDKFSYAFPETFPKQNIIILSPANAQVLANGNASIIPIATISFTKN